MRLFRKKPPPEPDYKIVRIDPTMRVQRAGWFYITGDGIWNFVHRKWDNYWLDSWWDLSLFNDHFFKTLEEADAEVRGIIRGERTHTSESYSVYVTKDQ